MASHFVGSIEYKTIQCYKCNTPFAMCSDLYRRRKDDGDSFYCPNGHRQAFIKTRLHELETQLKQSRQALSRAQVEKSIARSQRNNAARAHMRMRKRIQNGVCVCCNRTFSNLLQHMQTEHPSNASSRLRTARLMFGLTQSQLAEESSVNHIVTMAHVSQFERDVGVPDTVESELLSWIEKHTKD